MAKQNWNNIIDYIKNNLGVPYNLLELSDTDIINYIKEHTLSKFSQYIPHPIFINLSSINEIGSNITKHQYTYQLSDEFVDAFDIVGIQEVYYNTASGIMSSDLQTAFLNPLDTVLMNAHYNLNEDLQPVNAFQFIPPKTITFSREILPSGGYSIVAEVNTIHQSLDTIPSDVYHKIFKDLCLLDIIDWIINIRSKYSNLSTPFATINLNIDRLQNISTALNQKVEDYIANLPPKHILAWLD
jgi:hypothetical protein